MKRRRAWARLALCLLLGCQLTVGFASAAIVLIDGPVPAEYDTIEEANQDISEKISQLQQYPIESLVVTPGGVGEMTYDSPQLDTDGTLRILPGKTYSLSMEGNIIPFGVPRNYFIENTSNPNSTYSFIRLQTPRGPITLSSMFLSERSLWAELTELRLTNETENRLDANYVFEETFYYSFDDTLVEAEQTGWFFSDSFPTVRLRVQGTISEPYCRSLYGISESETPRYYSLSMFDGTMSESQFTLRFENGEELVASWTEPNQEGWVDEAYTWFFVSELTLSDTPFPSKSVPPAAVAVATAGSAAAGAAGCALLSGGGDDPEDWEDEEEAPDGPDADGEARRAADEGGWSLTAYDGAALPELCNTKGTAVPIPLRVDGPEGPDWTFGLIAVCPEAPKAVVGAAVGDQAVLTLTGKPMKRRSATVYCTAFAVAGSEDGLLRIETTFVATLRAKGLSATHSARSGPLSPETVKAQLVTDGNFDGIAEVRTLKPEEFTLNGTTLWANDPALGSCPVEEAP